MRRFLLSLVSLLVVSGMVASAANAYYDVDFPPLTNCPTSASPSIQSGSTATYPGRWWNPNRNGTGWDLLYSPDHTSLLVFWFTFDQAGRPTWLVSDANQLSFDPQTGATQWKSALYRTAWTHDSAGHGYATHVRVGSVALQLPSGTVTRAALAWQWDEASPSQSYSNECIYDFFRDVPPSTTPTFGINESYTANWFDQGHSGWGFDLIVGVDKNKKYTEVDTVQIYDLAGNPVWLQAQSPTTAAPPPSDNTGSPYQLHYIMGNGVPTVDCSTPSCFSVFDYPNTSITRNFTSPNSASVSITADIPASRTGAARILWPMDDVPASADVIRGTELDRIIASQVTCDTTSVQPNCSVQVSWSSADPLANAYRRNLVTGVVTVLGYGGEGDVPDTLSANERVQYELRRGSSSGMLYSVTSEVRALGLATAPAPALPAAPPVDSASDSVGYTGGQFRVDESGSATYRVPLNLPPGRGALTPTLALAYSSAGGDGVMGWGWSVEGVSTITKCRKTVEAGDGANGSIDFAAGVWFDGKFHSAFCLDGQRLLLVSGNEGRVGAEYRTEIDSFQTIVVESEEALSLGSATYYQPVAFKASRKDGTIVKFGKSSATDGRRLSQTVDGAASLPIASEWWQNELRDTNGNSVAYSYARDGSGASRGSLRLATITYVGGSVSFVYADRATPWLSFGYTVPVAQNEWLQRIDVKNGAQVLRSYLPTYETTPYNAYQKRPASLKECSDSVCYRDTVFDYFDPPSAVASQDTQGSGFNNILAYKYGDIDGDGRTDIVWINQDKKLYISFSRPTSVGLAFAAPVLVTTLDSTDERSWQLLDFNGDGREDLLLFKAACSTGGASCWQVMLSNSATFVAPSYSLPNSAAKSAAPQSILADYDGDGLPDVLVSDGLNGVKVWFMRRAASGMPYEFVGPTNVKFDCSPSASCPAGVLLQFDRNRPESVDFDGNGTSDLVLRYIAQPGCSSTSAPTAPPMAMLSLDEATQSTDATTDTSSKIYRFVNAGLVSDQSGTWQVFKMPQVSAAWSGSACQVETMRFVDINGDGLTDATWRQDGDNWWYQLATGWGQSLTPLAPIRSVATSCGGTPHCDVQFLDFDGDGRLDFWVSENPDATGNYKVYVWTGSGFDPSGQSVYAYSGGADWLKSFVDLDGDGYYDNLIIKADGAWRARRTTGHHQPRNMMSSISQGLGGLTLIDYAPMTFSSVYGREYATGWVGGRGSATIDVLTPRFVTRRVRSSAPTEGDPNALAEVRYRYAGFRMQGGGRGSLGFARVYTLDPVHGIETRTNYRQYFPYIGLPGDTYAVTGSVWTDNCAAGAENPGCMAYGTSWSDDYSSPRVVVSSSTEFWQSRDTVGASAKAKFVYKAYSTTVKRDLLGNEIGRELTNGFQYDDFGNLLASATNSYDANMSVLRTVAIANTYDNDTSRWILGRLRTSRVTTSRPSGDAPLSVVRTSSFDYDPNTGQLTVERLQPGGSVDQALTKVYRYDGFGNRVSQATCSGDVAEATCASLTAGTVAFHPSSDVTVQRFSKATFDSSGIFANASYGAFWSGSGAVERQVSAVLQRDKFGNPTLSSNSNGATVVAGYGALGRKYYEGSNTGVASTVTWRWCSGLSGVSITVPCPNFATYRVQTSAAGAPTSWAYFDRLDREVMTVRQGFDGAQFIAVRKVYDEVGRPKKVSEPYFTVSPSSGSIGTGSPIWTTTTYDAIGRVTHVDHPNGGATDFGFDGLTTVTSLPVNKAGIRERKTEVRSALGELFQVTDHLGSTITYAYDATGNVTRTTRNTWDGKLVVTQASYDVLGRRLTLNDPDAGAWTYAYNALGELVRKASGTSCTASLYDGQGRLWSRSDYSIGACTGTPDATSTWTYDTASHGLGSLAQVSSSDGGAAYTRTPSYDSYGREVMVTTNVLGNAYRQSTTYDQYGRIFQTLFNLNGYAQTGELYQYNAQGYQNTVRDAYPEYSGAIYYEVQAMDARGNVTQERHAGNNNLVTTRQYDTATGRLKGIVTANGTLQNLSYDYDTLGNLSYRQDTSGGVYVREEFQYDSLQRLVEGREKNSNGTDRQVRSYQYDGLGNLLGGPVGSGYVYGGRQSLCGNGDEVSAGPSALTALNGNQYCFDSRGNVLRILAPNNTPVEKAHVWYSAFDLPREMRIHNPYSQHTTQFRYGPERQRVRRVDYPADAPNSLPTTTDFVGNAEIIQKPGSYQREVKRYLPGLILSQTVNVSGASFSTATLKYEYLLTDNLGSTHRITDALGNVYAGSGRQSFDAFGRRADPSSGNSLGNVAEFAYDGSLTHHGYTGHEELDEFTWIHMNGRLYDTQTGRFLQADPVVSDPTNLQNLNRYSYVLNNPFAYTDPTGFWGHKEQGYLRTAVAVAISVYTAGTCAGAAWGAFGEGVTAGQAVAAGAIGGFASGAVASGTAKGGLLGAFTGAVGGGILQSSLAGTWGGIAVNATASGITSELNGGRFGSGFLSAGLSAVLAPHMETGNSFQDGLSAAVMGGTISAMTGGKFANGAATAAFSFSFKELMDSQVESYGPAGAVSEGNYISSPWDVPDYMAPRVRLAFSGDVTAYDVNALITGAAAYYRSQGVSLNFMVVPLTTKNSLRINIEGMFFRSSVSFNFFGRVSLMELSLMAGVDVFTHELAHAFGLNDRYRDIGSVSVAKPGYIGNLMGDLGPNLYSQQLRYIRLNTANGWKSKIISEPK